MRGRQRPRPEPSDLAVLAACPLFAALGRDHLRAVAAIARRERLGAGQVLFLAGDAPRGLHVVVAGSVKVFILSPTSGREVVLALERPHAVVAELPSFDGAPYPASAEALEDSELLVLDQAAFEALLHERPEVCLHLLRTLGQRLRRLVSLIEQLSFQEVAHRLAAHLLERSRAGLPFALETNAHIAAAIGTVPELVSRNLARLQNSGVLRLEGREVASVDAALLEAWAQQTRR